MRALFTSVNLCGDLVASLSIIPTWSKLHPEYDIEVRVQDQSFCDVVVGKHGWGEVKRQEGNFNLVRWPRDKNEYDFFHNLDLLRAVEYSWNGSHPITDGFGVQLAISPNQIQRRFGFVNAHLVLPITKFKKYVAITPFCGGAQKQKDGGSERSLPFPLWGWLIAKLNEMNINVRIYGFSKSPWEEFKKYITSPNVEYVSQENIVDSISEWVNLNCIGFITVDSGPLHCISAAIGELERIDYPILGFFTSLIPLKTNWPYGFPQDKVFYMHKYCGKITASDIELPLFNFIKNLK